jgi:hypothetical protein
MPQIYPADTNMQSGADVAYTVVCWDVARTRSKIFKNYGTDLKQARIDRDALIKFDIDAEIVTVGA